MPIYEYYSPDTNRIYSFYAKTLAQGAIVPRCPDDSKARMVKMISGFAVGGASRPDSREDVAPPDPHQEAAFDAMEKEFNHVDENDPKAMARMMRRMAQISGEKMDQPMEEAVRKLEEGADPESLESEMGDAFGGEETGETPLADRPGEKSPLRRRAPVRAPGRDPKLYDYS